MGWVVFALFLWLVPNLMAGDTKAASDWFIGSPIVIDSPVPEGGFSLSSDDDILTFKLTKNKRNLGTNNLPLLAELDALNKSNRFISTKKK